MSDELKVHTSLADVMEEVGGKCEPGLRPYRVSIPGADGHPMAPLVRFVISNSPGQAAMRVCEVETCSPKEVMNAVLEMYQRLRKAQPADQSKTSPGTSGTKPKRNVDAPDTSGPDAP